MDTKGFKRGDHVYHIGGGTGEIRTFENDWNVENPPVVVAMVRVKDTMFYDIRRCSIEDLRLDRRKEA